MKFRFSLAQVLKWRRHQTKQAQQAFLAAQQSRLAQEREIEHIEEALQELLEQSKQPTSTDPGYFRRLAAARLALQRRHAQEKQTLERLIREEEKAQKQLLEARKAEEALKTLQTLEYERHKQHLLEQERDFMDEQALQTFLRKDSSL